MAGRLLCLIAFTLLGTQAYEKGSFPLRVENFLERKCLKNANKEAYNNVLDELHNVIDNCLPFKLPSESANGDQLKELCGKHTEKVIECLEDFGDKMAVCLDEKETFLQKFIVDVYNSSARIFCEHHSLMKELDSIKTQTETCELKLKNHPDIDPSRVCHENSTIIGNKATDEIVVKRELCSEIMYSNFCYLDQLQGSCDDYRVVDYVRRYINGVIENCISTLFRGTTVFLTQPTSPTPPNT